MIEPWHVLVALVVVPVAAVVAVVVLLVRRGRRRRSDRGATAVEYALLVAGIAALLALALPPLLGSLAGRAQWISHQTDGTP